MNADILVHALLEDDIDLDSAMRDQPSTLPRVVARNKVTGDTETWWSATDHLDHVDSPAMHRFVAGALADAEVNKAVGRLNGTATTYVNTDEPDTVYELVDFTARDVRDIFDYLWNGGYLQ